MVNIEEFVKYWSKREENRAENRIAKAYSDASLEVERERNKLMQCLDCENIDGKLVAVFSGDAEIVVNEFKNKKSVFDGIRTDIEAFLSKNDGNVSLTQIAEKVQRMKRMIEDAEHAARISVAQAVRNSNMSVLEAEQSETVQKSYDNRDLVKEKINPELDILKQKLKELNSILSKY